MTDFETTVLLSRHAMECPFCRSINLHLIDMGTTFWINCGRCNANGPSANTPEQALEHWNWTEHINGDESVNSGLEQN